jgi:hypothetical protein
MQKKGRIRVATAPCHCIPLVEGLRILVQQCAPSNCLHTTACTLSQGWVTPEMHLICNQGQYTTAAHGLNHLLKRTYVHGLPQGAAQLDRHYVHAQHDCNHQRTCSVDARSHNILPSSWKLSHVKSQTHSQIKVKVTQVLVNKLANR